MPPLEKDFPYQKKLSILGGGTGTHTLLKGVTQLNQPELNTAVPGMWDDGFSTGRLRIESGILPVGDVRQCLIGMMEDKTQQLWALRLSQDRFKDMIGPLQGHDFLNLLLDRLNKTAGGFQAGVDAFRELFGIRGRVYPVTLMNVDLGSQFSEGLDLLGESKLDERWKEKDFNPNNKVEAIYFSTPVDANPLATQAMEESEIIAIPAGSLFGSILPHLLVEGVKESIVRSRAKLVFVLNLMTERGQTDTLDKASDYVSKFVEYLGCPERLDYLVINQNGIEEEPLEFYMEKGHQKPVEVDFEQCRKVAPKLMFAGRSMATYIQSQHLLRHHPLKLAEVVLDPEKFVLID